MTGDRIGRCSQLVTEVEPCCRIVLFDLRLMALLLGHLVNLSPHFVTVDDGKIRSIHRATFLILINLFSLFRASGGQAGRAKSCDVRAHVVVSGWQDKLPW